MKPSPAFKKVLQNYLVECAKNDSLFAANYLKSNKSLDDCITYILNTVQKSGYSCLADDEVYNMAIHYYDEDTIEVGKPVSCKAIVNQHVELTEEEKQQERNTFNKPNIQSYPVKKTAKAKREEANLKQLSLF